MFKGAGFLLSVIDCLGTVKGRKKLQKVVYLLELKGADIPYKYSYHHYGPYSQQLQEEISFLVREKFLIESKENGAYAYSVTNLGLEFKNTIKDTFDAKIIQDLLNDLNSKSPQFLELVSTYAFLREGGYDEAKGREKTLELKPHLRTEIEKAIEFYNSLIARGDGSSELLWGDEVL